MALDTWPVYQDDDGTGQTGSAVNKALVDAIKAAIEAEVSSVSNPTVKAAAIIDEVKAARGTMPSVDARLDVSLNEDGTFKTPASLITFSTYQAGLASRNIVQNGTFVDWTNGAAAAPDNWTLTSLSAIARTGAGESDTFTFGAGKYAAKLTRAGGVDGYLLQTIIPSGTFSEAANVKGQKVSAAIKAKSGIVNHIRLTFDDGATQTSSSFHTGGGTEEHLSVTHLISNSATKLEVRIEVKNSNGDAYTGGVIVLFADVAPTDWSYRSEIPYADTSIPGLLSLQAQTFVGAKTFTVPPVYRPGGAATANATVSGLRFSSSASQTNTNGVETTLHSVTLDAATMNVDGKILRIHVFGQTAANANVKTLKIYYGAAVVTLWSSAFNNQVYSAVVDYIRSGAAAGSLLVRVNQVGATVVAPAGAASTDINANAQIVKSTGTGVATADFTETYFAVEVIG